MKPDRHNKKQYLTRLAFIACGSAILNFTHDMTPCAGNNTL